MIKDIDGQVPAFPQFAALDSEGDLISSDCYDYGAGGMRLRDYFAAKAMQGMFASDTEGWNCPDSDAHKRAKSAYIMADAMLAERAK